MVQMVSRVFFFTKNFGVFPGESQDDVRFDINCGAGIIIGSEYSINPELDRSTLERGGEQNNRCQSCAGKKPTRI